MSSFEKVNEIILNRLNEKDKSINKYILIFILFLFVFNKKVGLGIAKGDSMAPRINDGDLIVYIKSPKKLNINDIVIVDFEKKIIKRVKKIENDQVYLLGDNILNSYDSRDYGAINKNKIIGKAKYILTLGKDNL